MPNLLGRPHNIRNIISNPINLHISRLTLTKLNQNPKTWQITMQEGRNRQIRRTFGALGYTVKKLHRTTFGPYTLGKLKPGAWEKVKK